MDDLSTARLQAVRVHMHREVTQDWDGVIATFSHPRYELWGLGEVIDGEAAVRGYLMAAHKAFPDQSGEVIDLACGDHSVFAEFWLSGTHLGPLQLGDRVAPATGKTFRVRILAAFEFVPGGDKIVCERVYSDQDAIPRALGLV
jgi:predicted ester cyclase